MSTPTTLRNIVGLPDKPTRLSDSALIMIDCQNTYREGIMQLEGVEPALEEAARLLARARALGIPVFHIMHDAGPGSPYDVRAEIGHIAGIVAPREGEAVIVKNYPSSFEQTDLHDRLQKVGAKNLILAGFMTHVCVNSTARAASIEGMPRPSLHPPRRLEHCLPPWVGSWQPAPFTTLPWHRSPICLPSSPGVKPTS